ncbi:helix-turn-helix domain-containing protein [Pedobacter chitinilyticus]|uniref:XRE family transcriptional regulator n=1 Tax=Pedobacter chitinilyticus TaxID=2233776 RepID=A0A3S3PHA8_9SPHI|nr:XRE family transcriptional regulator [Pedobacter chitinilyticus]RWU08115.1 XRE family transcriptional regulator [Pedobacter chitinilyticus]
MKDHALLQISQKIKDIRKSMNMTVQELADKAEVTKGLISQIENSRTVPSLLVLIQIIKALDIDINVFFKDINANKKETPILVVRANQTKPFEKEDAVGYQYNRIFSKSIKSSTTDFVLLELEPGAEREMVKTEAFEFKYIISGEVTYKFEKKNIILKEGDSMFFDGRIAHSPVNKSNLKALMLVVYFFE